MDLKALFSSKRDNWETPAWLFQRYHRKYGFTIDLAADQQNHKLPTWFGVHDDRMLGCDMVIDAFEQVWTGRGWLNPPYGEAETPCKPNCRKERCKERGYHLDEYRPGTLDWLDKARKSVFVDETAEVICILLPARTDTVWFHKFVWDEEAATFKFGVEVDFIPSRVKFLSDGVEQGTAPFPSMVVTFKGVGLL